jgi:hypothetical protein
LEADLHEFATEHVMMLFAPKEYPDISRQSFEAIAKFMKATRDSFAGVLTAVHPLLSMQRCTPRSYLPLNASALPQNSCLMP